MIKVADGIPAVPVILVDNTSEVMEFDTFEAAEDMY